MTTTYLSRSGGRRVGPAVLAQLLLVAALLAGAMDGLALRWGAYKVRRDYVGSHWDLGYLDQQRSGDIVDRLVRERRQVTA